MNLRELRMSKGLQRKYVAQKIGISGKHLNDIEAKRVNLTEKMGLRFAEFYKIDCEEIKKMYKEG